MYRNKQAFYLLLAVAVFVTASLTSGCAANEPPATKNTTKSELMGSKPPPGAAEQLKAQQMAQSKGGASTAPAPAKTSQ